MKRSYVVVGAAALVAAVGAWTGRAESASRELASARAEPLVARAAGQELPMERLAAIIGTAPVGVTRRNVANAAELWVSYQLLGYANAHGDELDNDVKQVDSILWLDILLKRLDPYFYQRIAESFPKIDSAQVEARYNRGDYLAAQHILITMPQGGAGLSQRKQDSIRAIANDILRRVTPANFSAMAKQYTEEPNGKPVFGSLGVFPVAPDDEAMLPEFEAAVKALRPGEITKTLVQSAYGFHIIRRHTLAEVRSKFVAKLRGKDEPRLTAAYVARLRTTYQVKLMPNVVSTIKMIARRETPRLNRTNKTVIATSTLGQFTGGRLAEWIELLPKTLPLGEMLEQAPDSTALRIVSDVIDREVLNAEALKANVNPNNEDMQLLRGGLETMRNIASLTLKIDAKTLRAASATVAGREEIAAKRAAAAIDKIFGTGGDDFAEIGPELAVMLRVKYPNQFNDASLDKAYVRALAIRAAIDSTKPKKVTQR